MCKIVAFTNSKKLDIKKASEAIGKILIKIEPDGYGYAIHGKSGAFGERSIAPNFKSRLKSKHIIDLPVIETRQEAFGQVDSPAGPAIFHGRTSTNEPGLLNCHPMSRDGWHLVHNGVVDDHGEKYAKNTTNDSEDLLHRLTLGIEHVEKYLSGYYAFAAIDSTGKLHVGRDSIATLFMAKCPKLNSFIIATTEYLLETVAEDLGIEIGPIDKISNNTYMVFESNELVHNQTIVPLGYDYRQAQHAELSLGKALPDGRPFDEKLASYRDEFDRHQYSDDGEALDDLMRELDRIDDSYTICNSDGEIITASEYHKLDEISKLDCDIQRGDGSYIDINGNYWNTRAG